jgi:hypothetical protein
MTYGRGLALALGFVSATALGVAIGPYLVDHPAAARPWSPAAVQQAERPAGPAAAGTLSMRESDTTTARGSAAGVRTSMTAAAPELHAKLRPLFVFAGEPDMTRVSAGFRDAEQFAAVAHAARNNDIPFALLRDRVIEKDKSLEMAIRELKPDVNASIEAQRAVAEARSDIAAIEG